MTTIGWLLGLINPWLYLIPLGVGAAYTAPYWLPVALRLWSWMPEPARLAVGAGMAALIAYIFGRYSGAQNALAAAKAKEAARADSIKTKADAARASADRDAISGGLRNDDGWQRKD